ncbi:AAA family ATPase [Desulfobulbus propionicus]|jgi:predicted kinase
MSASERSRAKKILPQMLVFLGMTASGKSTIAMAWADRCKAPYYNTDRVRKELLGLRATERRPDDIGQGIYSQAFTAQTYQTMLERARQDVAQGAALVVLDGSYSKRSDRDAVRRMAKEAGACCFFLYCVCSETETRRRLEQRAKDSKAVSDGRWEIYVHQRESFEVPGADEEGDCVHLNTERPLTELLKELTVQFHVQK